MRFSRTKQLFGYAIGSNYISINLNRFEPMAHLTIDEVEEFQHKPFKIRGNSQTYIIKHHGFGDRSLIQSDDEKSICIGTIPLVDGFTHLYFKIQFKHHGLSCEKKIYYRDTYPADSK